MSLLFQEGCYRSLLFFGIILGKPYDLMRRLLLGDLIVVQDFACIYVVTFCEGMGDIYIVHKPSLLSFPLLTVLSER